MKATTIQGELFFLAGIQKIAVGMKDQGFA
jgi:hypothetical protein